MADCTEHGSDEREEGEIVDDFEAISDYSIQSPSYSGKSVSPRGLLQDVSLSSISDTGDHDIYVATRYAFSGRKQKKRNKSQRHSVERKSKRRKKSEEYYTRSNHVLKKLHRRRRSTSDSKDNKLNYRCLQQLKNAMRIDTSHEVHQKSLRTRLQAMMQRESTRSQAEEDEEVEALRMLALLSNAKMDSEPVTNNSKANCEMINVEEEVIEILEDNEKKAGENDEANSTLDDELIELRLAALKSAVMKKAAERKKRKEKLNSNAVVINDINKENEVNRENNKKSFPSHNEDDVIVISDNGTNESNCDIKEITENANAAASENLISPNVNTDGILLECNVLKSSNESMNATLEEDVDIMRAVLLASMSKRITSAGVQNSLKSTNKGIQAKDHLMKGKNQHSKQIPVVFKNSKLPIVKPLIINLNDSDSDTDTLDRKKVQTKLVTNKDKDLADNVTQFLKQQRAVVEAKSKIQNFIRKEPTLDKSVVKLLPKSQQQEYQFLKQKLLMAKRKRLRKTSTKPDVKNFTAKKLVKVKAQNTGTNLYVTRSRQEVNLNGLQKTIEDMQIQKNGRLQMKGKYKELTPLLRKVNEATTERKKYEMEVKTLLEELKKTRNKVAMANQEFTLLVKCLMQKKEAIDQRPNGPVDNKVPNDLLGAKVTSTPIKSVAQESVCDNTTSSVKDISSIFSLDKEDIIVVTTDNIEENNVVTELPRKRYVSPLDIKNRGDAVNDPLGTFCPYELFGVCRDPECKFSHYSKT